MSLKFIREFCILSCKPFIMRVWNKPIKCWIGYFVGFWKNDMSGQRRLKNMNIKFLWFFLASTFHSTFLYN